MKDLHIITDLQYGSTGKGLFAGYLAETLRPDTLITAWGPNAGHTYVNRQGTKFVNIALPNGIVSPNVKRILIGPGSVINPDILRDELERYYQYIPHRSDVLIHPHAAVVTEYHRHLERGYAFKIGSTMKGVGEAMISKIRRDPDRMNIASHAMPADLSALVCSVEQYNMAMDQAKVGLLEGAQGFSLSINHGQYPYTTSRDCTTTQLLTDCAVPVDATDEMTIYGVCRTYPIRVANRWETIEESVDLNEIGKLRQIGTSGPCYPDQAEIQWESIGREPELTTVTKLPRRIFTFSEEQIKQAIRMNGVDFVFLNFCNYMERDKPSLLRVIETIEQYAPVNWTGWGPSFDDVSEDVSEPRRTGRA